MNERFSLDGFSLSSLSMSLILLILLGLAAVLGYNAWVSRRRGAARRESLPAQGAARPPSDRGVAAASAGRAEPSLTNRSATGDQVSPAAARAAALSAGQTAGAAPTGDRAQAGSEPSLGNLDFADAQGTVPTAASAHDRPINGLSAGTAETSAPATSGFGDGVAQGAAQRALPAGAPGGGTRLHPLTDCIIEFELTDPIAADRLLPTAHAFRRVGSKPVILEACTSAPESSGELHWGPLVARQRLFRVRVGVQLANRHGPLNAMEYSEFVNGVQALAEQLALLGDTPDMNTVLQRARALDESCAALDAQIGINVEAPDALGLSELARLAQETGCTERGNNRYARLAEQGEVVYSLSLSDSPTRLSLLLDVPRAPLAAQPWAAMVACARHCVQRLGARMVDDQGRALTEASLQRIEQQLLERQQALVAAGLTPGSSMALRVFN